MTIGQRVRALRKEHKLKLRHVAGLIGLSVSHLSDVELDRHDPSLETLRKIATLYGLRLEELLREVD